MKNSTLPSPDSRGSNASPFWAAAVPTLLVICLVAWAYHHERGLRHQVMEQDFHNMAQTVSGSLVESFHRYEEVAYSLVSFYQASVQVDREEFHAFVQRPLGTYPGFHSLQWVPRVPRAERQAIEQSARDEGKAGFQFKQLTTNDGWAYSEADWAEVYFPTYFIEPPPLEGRGLGLDLGSIPVWADALKEARDLNSLVVTPPLDPATEAGFGMVLPVFRNGTSTDTLEDRRRHLLGYLVADCRLNSMLAISLDNPVLEYLSVTMTGIPGQIGSHQFIGSSRKESPVDPQAADLEYQTTHRMGGREWTLIFTPRAAYLERHASFASVWTLIGGGVLAGLVFLFLYTLANRTVAVEQLVGKQTEELQEANETILQRNQALAASQRTLEDSNRELEQFAYVASHDLQTPLRAITGFAQFLQMEYEGRLDETADDYINRIIGGTKRMQQMIKDLLTYSRVQSKEAPFQAVDLNDVFDEVLVLNQDTIQALNAEVVRDELPQVLGNRGQLFQLLHNLVENGLKYHGDAPPRLTVRAQPHESGWELSVADNGIGIAPEHQKKVFDLFHRLHSQEEYPGTGIGLSICRRIVQRHKGQFRLVSEAGQGATFSFTLAAVPEQQAAA